jgi:hypothetical protein
MRLPTKDSAVVRALRVLMYTVIPSVLTLLSDPEFVKLLVKYYPAQTGFVLGAIPTIALIYNIVRRDVPNY